jgi:hypothetical protein
VQEARAKTAPGFFMRVRHWLRHNEALRVCGSAFAEWSKRDKPAKTMNIIFAGSGEHDVSAAISCSSRLFGPCYFWKMSWFGAPFRSFCNRPAPFTGIYRAGRAAEPKNRLAWEACDCRLGDTGVIRGWWSNFRHALV